MENGIMFKHKTLTNPKPTFLNCIAGILHVYLSKSAAAGPVAAAAAGRGGDAKSHFTIVISVGGHLLKT